MWLDVLEESLRDLKVDMIDAYYQMGANNTDLIGSEEMRMAFEQARDAGKVRFWGLSTHQNAEAVMEKAIETGWYDPGHDRHHASGLVRLGRQEHPVGLAADDRAGAAARNGRGRPASG